MGQLIDRVYIQANAKRFTSQELVEMFLAEQDFENKDSYLYGVKDVCVAHLSVWVKYAYFSDIYGDTKLAHLQKTFKKFMKGFVLDYSG